MRKKAPGVLLIALALVACAVGEPALPRNWHAVMNEVVGPLYESVLAPALEADPERLDLPAVAGAARRTANAIALGHGPLVNEKVESFAVRAREAEAFLLALAGKAERGERAGIRGAIRELSDVHCKGCHDAAEAFPELRR